MDSPCFLHWKAHSRYDDVEIDEKALEEDDDDVTVNIHSQLEANIIQMVV